MKDQKQTPHPEDAPQPPEEVAAATPDVAKPLEEATESLEKTLDLDKTLELPVAATAGPAAPVATTPPAGPTAPAVEPAVSPPEQPTEVAPVVAPDLEMTTESLVPPPSEAAPPVADIDISLSDTSEFTMSDITLGDIGGSRLMGWLHGLKKRPAPQDYAQAVPASEPVSEPVTKARRWGLRPWQWALIGVGALVFIVAVLISVDGGLYYNRVHHGIQVAGQDLSGMSNAKAVETLAVFAEESQKQPITLTSGKRTWSVLPGDLDTVIDVPAAVARAMALTRQGNVFVDLVKKVALYFAGDDIPLEGTFDQAKMEALLAKIAKALDVPAVNATLQVKDGTIEVVEGKQGNVVDQETLRQGLTRLLFTFHATELAIPMVTTSPDLSAVDVEPALAQANVMISDDLVLTHKGETVATLKPEEIVTFVDVAPGNEAGGSKTVPILSVEEMATFLRLHRGQGGHTWCQCHL